MHDKVKDEETKNQINNEISEYFDLSSIGLENDADNDIDKEEED